MLLFEKFSTILFRENPKQQEFAIIMIKNSIKTCSFFGHRDIEITEELRQKVKNIVEDLILKHNVLVFLFGSRSNFDTLCHLVVTDLKEEYKDIKRIAYNCKSETCIFENERTRWEDLRSFFHLQNLSLPCVEEEFEHKTKYTSGKASYVERNQAMINDSDYCVFYYDKDYKPKTRKRSMRKDCFFQPKSGTALAYAYAKQKKKTIINLASL